MHHVLLCPQPSVLWQVNFVVSDNTVVNRHIEPHSFILQVDNENMRTLEILALRFLSVSTFDATEMMRPRVHACHSRPEFLGCNSCCFVTCAPQDLAMQYQWCYIANGKILISNKQIINFSLQIFCWQLSSCSTPMQFPTMSENQPCMSPHLFITKMTRDRFGGTSFPKTAVMSGVWSLSLPFKSPMIWGIPSYKISVLSVCFDPYRYMSSFGCHACTRKGLHEATLPRTWIC